MHYNADEAPNPSSWLALDREERVRLVEAAHPTSDILHPAGMDLRRHAAVHVVVEDHIAAGTPAATALAMARLTDEGLRRHAAVHCIGDRLLKALARAAIRGGALEEDTWAAEARAIEPHAWLARQLPGDFQGG